MDHQLQQTRVDPRKQALLEARFFGGGSANSGGSKNCGNANDVPQLPQGLLDHTSGHSSGGYEPTHHGPSSPSTSNCNYIPVSSRSSPTPLSPAITSNNNPLAMHHMQQQQQQTPQQQPPPPPHPSYVAQHPPMHHQPPPPEGNQAPAQPPPVPPPPPPTRPQTLTPHKSKTKGNGDGSAKRPRKGSGGLTASQKAAAKAAAQAVNLQQLQPCDNNVSSTSC